MTWMTNLSKNNKVLENRMKKWVRSHHFLVSRIRSLSCQKKAPMYRLQKATQQFTQTRYLVLRQTRKEPLALLPAQLPARAHALIYEMKKRCKRLETNLKPPSLVI